MDLSEEGIVHPQVAGQVVLELRWPEDAAAAVAFVVLLVVSVLPIVHGCTTAPTP